MLPAGKSQLTELSSVQMKQEEPVDLAHPHVKYCCVHPGYPWTSVWTGPPSDIDVSGVGALPDPHAVHPGMLDPLSGRYIVKHWP